jgi:hypothetical protein
MHEVEDLRKRRDFLELERDIAQLERRARIKKMVSGWSWLWVAPLSLGAAVSLIGGLGSPSLDGALNLILFGVILICPAVFKLILKL